MQDQNRYLAPKFKKSSPYEYWITKAPLIQIIDLEEQNLGWKTLDTDFHEAITNIPAPSKKEKGKVIDVIEKGYMLGEKVLRYAKVVIGN